MIRRKLSTATKNIVKIIGIETSCDDTAISVVSMDKTIHSSKRYTNRSIQKELGGISPKVCADQHNLILPKLLKEVRNEIDFNELSAVAVTTTPGLVIALKEGIKCGIELARSLQIPLIPVHHMKAHALSILLETDRVRFPFVSLLISGGHALIAEARSVEDFCLFGKSISGSPGECFDKIAREYSIGDEFHNVHAGRAIELLAERASLNGHMRYSPVYPSTSGADMNFSHLKSTMLNILRKQKNSHDFSYEDFSASLQFAVARHISTKLNSFLDWYTSDSGRGEANQIVLGGGVASNTYIFNAIKKVSQKYGFETFRVSPYLCTDNAEMIAYTGSLLMSNGSDVIIPKDEIPDMIYANARTDIGIDRRNEIPSKPERKLVSSTIHGDSEIRFQKDYKCSNAESKDIVNSL